MVNYQNGKVYRIWSNQTDLVYIGSTTQTLCKRIGEHRRKKKFYEAEKHNYCYSFALLAYPDAKIELVEEYPCENRQQLEAREGYHQRLEPNLINKKIQGRTKKEYREANKEKTALKESVAHDCPCGARYTHKHKARHERTKKHLDYIKNG